MHDTAFALGRLFFETYFAAGEGLTVVDVGAADVNGTLRDAAPPGCRYIGIDMAEGKGVDLVAPDPHALPMASGTADAVVCSSCLEHAEHFWLLFAEMQRILRPEGLCYINVPSNGVVHRYPVDCWRFYPDSGAALASWARRCGHRTELLESFTARRAADVWNDYVAVFAGSAEAAARHPQRMSGRLGRVYNLTSRGAGGDLRQDPEQALTEDMLIQRHLAGEVAKLKAELARARQRIASLGAELDAARRERR